MIYDPVEEYEKTYRDLHFENTKRFLDGLVRQSNVDIEANRKTVKEYVAYKQDLVKLKRKLNWLRFWRIVMILTLVLIPLVIWKLTPKIRALREEISHADQKAAELLQKAYNQMLPLNSLFTDKDCIRLIEQTIPQLEFAPCFTAKQEEDMRINYDLTKDNIREQSSIDVLAGTYNENPFLFENRLIHTMGTETYHGYKTIHWTETYRDSDGKLRTRTKSQTLEATVTKPKPFYHTQVVLYYGAQGGPELCFSRDATHLDRKSDKSLERYIKKGERKLKKKTDRSLGSNGDFVHMSNSEFEVLFDALDRTDEVQFRMLFTPLAQTNMVEVLLSDSGYGDDFHFIKLRRMNKIISGHSQGRDIQLSPNTYVSYAFDIIQQNFMEKNVEFFRAVYFDFAPLWAIPMYQERPVHSLKPIPDFTQRYAHKECEALANAVKHEYVVHPDTKTRAILKSTFIQSEGDAEKINITAYSYDIAKRVDVVSVRGGDGRYHKVSVPWDEYLPLEASNDFYVAAAETAQDRRIMARRNHLCIFHS